MISHRALAFVPIAAIAGVFLLIRSLRRLSLRKQFVVLLALSVSIGFILLAMVQMPGFPEWLGLSLMAIVFAASFFSVRIFLSSLAQEEKQTENEAHRGDSENPPKRSIFNPASARDAR